MKDTIPYFVESKEQDTFTINVKGTKIYKDLQQKIELLQNDLDGANSKLSDLMKSHLKAVEYIKKDEFVDYIPNSKSYLRLMKIRCDLLQILGVKE